ncbi:LysR family transcriptional regulator [Kiloniella sp. EL199]|uniref:LysR family transcriptional regulator n=1 Tax=Kiloniella sp. EL199 TaxID=2107581 RepID=UPI000EA2324C|nr:LysR family transcriptional regulator [Kiloniella sp. EL199]
MNANYHHLEAMAVFAVVVEEGSFTRAATRLGHSKAHVSQLVSRLEKHFNTQLLFRTTRKLDLTEAGSIFYGHCKEIAGSVEKAQKELEAIKGTVSGSLRLSAPISFGEAFLSDITLGFNDLYPDVKFELELDNKIKDLQSENIDLAFRATTQMDDNLVPIKVGDWTEYICASPEYLENKSPIIRPQDLLDHRCLLNAPKQVPTLWHFQNETESHRVSIEAKLCVHHFPMLKKAILSGGGVGKLPSYLAETEIAEGKLVRLLPSYRTKIHPIFLVYPYQTHLPIKVRKFIDFVKNWFSERDHFLK